VTTPGRTLRLTLLPSPLLGPATYEPLASALVSGRAQVTIADLPVEPTTPQSVLAGFESALAAGADVVVAHSNAGYYLPALLERRSVAAVAMDAALPAGDTCETRLAPPAFAELVRSLPVFDGRLPPWPTWWERAAVTPLFPDDAWFERVCREAPRLPAAYFSGRLPVPQGWMSGPRAYVAFGGTYAEEVAFAEGSGWLVRRLEGHHLTHLTSPDVVARLLLSVCDSLLA
jgi:hypothetical protein